MVFEKSGLSKGSLRIEMIPQSTFFSNLRKHLSRGEWDKVRRKCYNDYNYKCAICFGIGKQHPVECHELWSFDDKNKIQRLDGVIALCPKCHSVVHFGFTQTIGNEEEAFEQLKKVNKWNDKKAYKHIQSAFDKWEERSNINWTVDFSWLENNL